MRVVRRSGRIFLNVVGVLWVLLFVVTAVVALTVQYSDWSLFSVGGLGYGHGGIRFRLGRDGRGGGRCTSRLAASFRSVLGVLSNSDHFNKNSRSLKPARCFGFGPQSDAVQYRAMIRLPRILLNAATVMSIMFCVVTAVLWARSPDVP